MTPDYQRIDELVKNATEILIVQADNPDADSLGSALALEQVIGDLGSKPLLYCAVDIPGYLHYLPGWDRVERELPSNFDASIIVDTSTLTLLEKLVTSNGIRQLAAKPCVVLDHHQTVSNDISFASITVCDPHRSSTGELIYDIATALHWPMSVSCKQHLMNAILGDTQGLSNSLATSKTYRIMADMIDSGVDRSRLEESRRAFGKMPQSIYRYKAELIKRTEFYVDGRLALVSIPQSEINDYSPLYNPAPLIQNDMLQTEGVGIGIVLKIYNDGHVTGAIRANPTFSVAAELAEHFGGGGHAYASGFKVKDSRSFEDIKMECIQQATELLSKVGK